MLTTTRSPTDLGAREREGERQVDEAGAAWSSRRAPCARTARRSRRRRRCSAGRSRPTSSADLAELAAQGADDPQLLGGGDLASGPASSRGRRGRCRRGSAGVEAVRGGVPAPARRPRDRARERPVDGRRLRDACPELSTTLACDALSRGRRAAPRFAGMADTEQVPASSSSAPASAGSARRGRCASAASPTSPCSSAPTRSAGCGATTPTPAPPATCPRRSTPGRGRSTRPGAAATPSSPRSSPTCATRPSARGSPTWSSPAPRSPRAPGTTRPPRWRVTCADGTAYDAEVVVSAMGQLSNPVVPRIPGVDTFAGPAFHSAQWRHDVDLRRQAGRRRRHRRQRDPVRAGHRRPGRRDDGVPALGAVRRPEARPGVQAPPPPGLRPLPGAAARRAALGVLADREAQRGARRRGRVVQGDARAPCARPGSCTCAARCPTPALRAKLVPDYDIGCKRILFSNDWYPALAREHVDVVTHPVTAVEADGVRTDDGTPARGRRDHLGHRLRRDRVPRRGRRHRRRRRRPARALEPTAPTPTWA